jgi:cellulose synthase/poly-beta-1,6-N-acetylglucosamine synthase-like glycosyltransferase
VQVYYEAAVGPSGLSRLRRLAFMLIHWSRPLGASRLGLGTGLKGNGMAVRWELASAGLGSAGITEDASMTLALAERGVAVAFEPRASVEGYMAHSYDDAVTQDSRWEGGRIALWPTAMRAAANALLRGRVAAAAAALELASPPLSLLATVSALAVVVGTLTRSAALPVALAGAGSLLSYVTIGLIAARASWADVAALRFAPRFVVHKLIVLAQVVAGRSATTWQRTERR